MAVVKSVPSTVAGFKIYYGTGQIVSSKGAANMLDAWKNASNKNVCIVVVYYAETYQIWHDNHWDTENYKKLLSSADYYAFDGGTFYSYDAGNVPPNLPTGTVKQGGLVSDGRYDTIFNSSLNDCVF